MRRKHRSKARSTSRRTALKVIGAAGLAAITASVVSSGANTETSSTVSPAEFFKSEQAHFYGAGYPTNQIPVSLRHPNLDGSCVHLSVAVCLISIGEFQLGADWLSAYNHGEYSSRLVRRMTDRGLLFATEVNGDANFLDYWAGHTNSVAKRVMGVTFGARHVMNLLDIDPAGPGAKAYLLNNQRRSNEWAWNTTEAAEVSREAFISNWSRNGGWAFTILGTTKDGTIAPVPPIPVYS